MVVMTDNQLIAINC